MAREVVREKVSGKWHAKRSERKVSGKWHARRSKRKSVVSGTRPEAVEVEGSPVSAMQIHPASEAGDMSAHKLAITRCMVRPSRS